MNYEEFYAALSPLTKTVKGACSAADKNGKKTVADAENGNLADLAKAMDDLEKNRKAGELFAGWRTCGSIEELKSLIP